MACERPSGCPRASGVEKPVAFCVPCPVDSHAESPSDPATVPWWHWVWVAPLALFLRLWLATLRVRADDSTRDIEGRIGGNAVLLLWHDRLFFAPIITQRYLTEPVCALISASKDGGWLTAFYRLMGIRSVRGSSNRRGAEALVALARAMRAGCHAGVTPDGPKGPRREAKPGLLALARISRRPVVLLGIRYHSAWRLRSWDRFALPLPFSRVDLTFEPVAVADDESGALRAIGDRLTELSGD